MNGSLTSCTSSIYRIGIQSTRLGGISSRTTCRRTLPRAAALKTRIDQAKAARTPAKAAPESRPAAPQVTSEEATVLRGPAARVVTNMEASLGVPTATSVRAVPAKLLIDNRVVIKPPRTQTAGEDQLHPPDRLRDGPGHEGDPQHERLLRRDRRQAGGRAA